VVKEHYNKKILYAIVYLVFIANTINIGADVGAMVAAVHLIYPIKFFMGTILIPILILILVIFFSYKSIANILKWLSLFLFSYLITLCIIDVSWQTVLKATFIPHLEFNF